MLEISQELRDLVLVFYFQNLGKSSIRMREMVPSIDVTIEDDSKSKFVMPRTASSFGRAGAIFDLPPGGRHVQIIPLSKQFAFTEPGNYIISVKFDSLKKTAKWKDYAKEGVESAVYVAPEIKIFIPDSLVSR